MGPLSSRERILLSRWFSSSKKGIHPQKLTWIPKMMMWKRYLLLNKAIFGIYVRFSGVYSHWSLGFWLLFPRLEKPHRGEDLEAKGPQLAKNLRLRHSEIFWWCENCGKLVGVEDMVCLVCVFVGILFIFLVCGHSLHFPFLLLIIVYWLLTMFY